MIRQGPSRLQQRLHLHLDFCTECERTIPVFAARPEPKFETGARQPILVLISFFWMPHAHMLPDLHQKAGLTSLRMPGVEIRRKGINQSIMLPD